MNEARIMSATHCAEHLLGADFKAVVCGHAKQHEENLGRLLKANERGDRRKVRSAQEIVLRSFSSKLVCLTRSVRKHPGLTADWMFDTAGKLCANQDPGEIISAWGQEKSSGNGWRPVCGFGSKRKALQTLVGDILVTKFGVDPIDYLAKARGADIASDQIVSLVGAGFTHFVLADIENCFRSVQHESLKEATGLPGKVVTTCLLIGPDASLRTLSLPLDVHPYAFDGAVRQGLPQGSRCSNLVMSLLLGPELRSIASVDRIVVHGDDIAIAVHDKEGAMALKKALADVLEHHPAGPFRLKRCEVANIYTGFDFLKYRQCRDGLTGEVKRRPAARSYARLYGKVVARAQTETIREAVRGVVAYRRKWISAFPRWQPSTEAKSFMAYEMEHQVRDKAPTKWRRFIKGRHQGRW